MSIEVGLSTKLLDLFQASVKYKPETDKKHEVRDVLDLLEDHSALYNDFDLEDVGGVANSIKILRKRLSDMKLSDGFARELRGFVQVACIEFQTQAEKLSNQYDKSPKAIYEKHEFFQKLPTGYSASFSLRLGELRGKVRICLEQVRKQKMIIPIGLEKLLRT